MKYTLLGFLLAMTSFLFAQNTERRSGEILVQLNQGADIQTVLNQAGERSPSLFSLKEVIAPDWHMYLLGFDETRTYPQTALAQAWRMPGIRAAQFNTRVYQRDLEPNDPSWSQQNDMMLIKAPLAWEASIGGLTPAGDTIVVAVLEKGAFLSHPDLAPNRWYNWAEIPNNDLDDDGNGYIDDFGGWNPRTLSDDPGAITSHGTGVNGIIGAVGNNDQGVTGVNWKVKLMNLGNVEYESEIIAAYYYVGNMRRIYNQSNGAKGAFVVSSNASFGLDKQKAEDHQLWCAVYDSLGAQGIISVGATTNQNVNVDMEGDMPTSCTSEYLITVNNINEQGVKMAATGYGAVSIDLGAPGDATFTTAGVNSPTYGNLGGTSAATPHVTGALALLYSFDCKILTSDALSNPQACARRIRDLILQHTEPNASLSGLTVTGGHLNLSAALGAVQQLNCIQEGPLNVCDSIRTGSLEVLCVKWVVQDQLLRIHFDTPSSEGYSFRVFNMLGQLIHEEALRPQAFGISLLEYHLEQIPAGMYVFVIGKGKNYVSRKFPKF